MTSFLRRLRNLFGRSSPRIRPSSAVRRSAAMEDQEPLDMMEQLSMDSMQLRQELRLLDDDQSGKEKAILEYLKRNATLHAPIDDFPKSCDWFNVKEPLSLDGNLRGKIVVLDFFTYCCINCMHILPDLAALEHAFPVERGLVVVGVHSAKFANEKVSQNILAAAQRYNIAHPVLNDSQFVMWRKLNVHCWPTLLVVGPNKNPLFVFTGEGHGELLKSCISATLKFYGDSAAIKGHSLPIAPSTTDVLQGSVLRFPAKVACNSKGLVAISDSGNHRILVVNKIGHILAEIGSGVAGLRDGSFAECRFNSPQGLCFYGSGDRGEVLFVADTENHAIRRIDLAAKTVETVVGTGQQGNDYKGGRVDREQEISSPWDVLVVQKEIPLLLIAMAGTHQLWAYFLDDCRHFWRGAQFTRGQCAAVAGSGREANQNNSYPANAAFAQPSGLALDTGRAEVFVADSESSAVRKIALADGKVQAVVGGDRNPQNLHAFGDVDGKGVAAKLQHPLGVCFNPGDKFIYVADTYNHKVKRIDPQTNSVESLVVKGRGQQKEEEWRFSEPGGLCVDETGEFLIVANTNNHSVDFVSLRNFTVESLAIGAPDEMDLVEKRDLVCPVVTGRASEVVRVAFVVRLGEGIHFTADAPQKVVASFEGTAEKEERAIGADGRVHFEWQLPSGGGRWLLKVRLSLCEDDLCFPKNFSVECPLQVTEVPEETEREREFTIMVDKKGVWWASLQGL